ncbi:DarT ssDNA thymidine ADP-ribosyltransferase family protein [Azospirillum ramasamyi]|uniref:DarT ssDNA thymidine ADP-ribosyltransferase family protein n=1 Tax=Azospirillum ramasamyi TaxID=682998 RepID=UPI0013A6F5A4|nr:DarT ssDNA thymidine ADP-ribosyltransferase family protein [Azospirillum ramasamyi]
MTSQTNTKLSVADIVESRNITEVVHFTSNFGLVGCLNSGNLLSRRQLPQEQTLKHVLEQTSPVIFEDQDWFDKKKDWVDYVNMSLSEINSSYFRFANEKWHPTGDRYWIIMSFDPKILTHDDVHFSTTNNVYDMTVRTPGADGLEALFAPTVRRKSSSPNWVARRSASTPSSLTTCEQAEVLYPRAVSMEYLRTVYVQCDDHADWAKMVLNRYKRQGVPIIAGPAKFQGRPSR